MKHIRDALREVMSELHPFFERHQEVETAPRRVCSECRFESPLVAKRLPKCPSCGEPDCESAVTVEVRESHAPGCSRGEWLRQAAAELEAMSATGCDFGRMDADPEPDPEPLE